MKTATGTILSMKKTKRTYASMNNMQSETNIKKNMTNDMCSSPAPASINLRQQTSREAHILHLGEAVLIYRLRGDTSLWYQFPNQLRSEQVGQVQKKKKKKIN